MAATTMANPPPNPPPADIWCERCTNTGWEPTPSGAVRRCVDCPWLEAKRGCAPGVPVAERDATMATYQLTSDNGDGVKHAQYFIQGVHPGLYLWGPVGTGKTRLACSILNDLWRGGQSVRFKRCPELLMGLQPGADEENRLWQQIVGVPVLVLDDVGANQGTDFARRMLQALFDARLDLGHRTIWTSNLDLDQLGDFLADDRLPSRIVGNAKIVKLTGKDWRLRKRTGKRPAASKPAESPTRDRWSRDD
jgi:predicted ATPase